VVRLGCQLVVLVAIVLSGCSAAGHAELTVRDHVVTWDQTFELNLEDLETIAGKAP
jgi:PBP1b-binding outer membrane lipoprotein LpoB